MKKTLKENNNKKIKKESLKIIKNKQKKTQKNKFKGGSYIKDSIMRGKDSIMRGIKSGKNVLKTTAKSLTISGPSNLARTMDMGAFYNFLPGNSEVKDNLFIKTSNRMTKNLYINLKANLMALACIDHLTFLEMMFNNPYDISDYVNLNSHVDNNSYYSPNVVNYKSIINIQNDKLKMENRKEKRNNIESIFKEKFNEKFNDENTSKIDTEINKKFIKNFNTNIEKMQKFAAEKEDPPADQPEGKPVDQLEGQPVD